MKILVDWQDFEESFIYDLSSKFAVENGFDAFDKAKKSTLGASVPFEVSSSFPNAKYIYQSFKSLIESDKKVCEKNHRFKVLELAAGAGVFARHFLYAARDDGFLDKIEYHITDISEKSLEQIEQKKF